MNRLIIKTWTRFVIATFYGASQVVSSFIRFFTAWLVFQLDAPALWGDFIQVSITVQLLSAITGWGQRDYLIKKFSLNPKDMHQHWGASVVSRLPVLFGVAAVLVLLPFPNSIKPFLVLWLLGNYITASFQVIVLQLKDFKFSFWNELLTGIILPIMVYLCSDDLSLGVLISVIVASVFVKFIVSAIRYRAFLMLRYFAFDRQQLIDSFPFFFPSIVGMVQSRMDTYFVAVFLDELTLAYYNVFMSLLNFSYNLVSFTIVPFIKNLYRIEFGALRKLHRYFILLSVLLGIIAMTVSKLIIENYYEYVLPDMFYLIGVFNIVAFAIYVFVINKLFRLNKQKMVSLVPLLILVLQVPCALLVIPKYQLDGAVIVNFAGQALTVAFFLYLDNKYSKSENSYK